MLCQNRKARHEYEVHEKFEAGMVLIGPEVKAILAGRMDLSGSYVEVREDGAWLKQSKITPLPNGAYGQFDPERPRKLLLHRSELAKLRKATTLKGWTCVPFSVYLKIGIPGRSTIKAQVCLCTGKNQRDKRQTIKDRDLQREGR